MKKTCQDAQEMRKSMVNTLDDFYHKTHYDCMLDSEPACEHEQTMATINQKYINELNILTKFRLNLIQAMKFRQCFNTIDTNKDGSISMNELRQVYNKVGEHVTDEELQTIIQSVDVNSDGKI